MQIWCVLVVAVIIFFFLFVFIIFVDGVHLNFKNCIYNILNCCERTLMRSDGRQQQPSGSNPLLISINPNLNVLNQGE